MTTRAEAWEKRNRAVKLARTYLRKSEAGLFWGADLNLPSDPSYWDLLDTALDTAFEILRALPDDFFETRQVESFFGLPGGSVNLSDAPDERLEKIVNLMEQRRVAARRNRRIGLLRQVEGRTPEEAEAYLAKAKELAGRR